jgi:hypothetical protein
LAALTLLVLAATAEALEVSVEAYRGARNSGALGVVAGRVADEPRTLRMPARPFTGTTVTLLPHSKALVARLEQLREGSRESSTAYAAAAPAMRTALEAYERELLQAGAPDLTLIVLVDHDGRFEIDEVPAGAWMLIAWHGSPVGVPTPKPEPGPEARRRDPYRPQSRLQGYRAVTVWLRELTVAGGATATLDLTDRNGWFRGVVEERTPGAGR